MKRRLSVSVEIKQQFEKIEKGIERLSELSMRLFTWNKWNALVYPYLRRMEDTHNILKEIFYDLNLKQSKGGIKDEGTK